MAFNVARPSSANVSVWWDLDDCPIPPEVPANRIADAITSTISRQGNIGRVTIAAFKSYGQLQLPMINELKAVGISVTELPCGGSKASEAILAGLVEWILNNSPPSPIAVISNSYNTHISKAVRCMKRRGYEIFLVSSANAFIPTALLAAATKLFQWDILAKNVPPQSTKWIPPGEVFSPATSESFRARNDAGWKNEPSHLRRGQHTFFLEVFKSLERDKLAPTMSNVMYRIKSHAAANSLNPAGLIDVLQLALNSGEFQKKQIEGGLSVILPKVWPNCWPCVDVHCPKDVYPPEVWSAFVSFLKSHRSCIEETRSRYAAAEYLEKNGPIELRELALGELIHMLQLAITRRWLIPHSTKLWTPLKICLPENQFLERASGIEPNGRSLSPTIKGAYAKYVPPRTARAAHGHMPLPTSRLFNRQNDWKQEVRTSERINDRASRTVSSGQQMLDLKHLLGELLHDNPEGYQLCRIKPSFSTKYGYELDVQSLGYESLIRLMTSLSDLVHIRHTPKGELLFPSSAFLPTEFWGRRRQSKNATSKETGFPRVHRKLLPTGNWREFPLVEEAPNKDRIVSNNTESVDVFLSSPETDAVSSSSTLTSAASTSSDTGSVKKCATLLDLRKWLALKLWRCREIGIHPSLLDVLFEQETGLVLDKEVLGCNTLEDVFRKMPDIAEDYPCQGESMVCASSPLLFDVEECIKSVLEEQPEGVDLAQLKREFEMRYEYPLQHEKLGFQNLRSLVEDMGIAKLQEGLNGEPTILLPLGLQDFCAEPRTYIESLRMEGEQEQFASTVFSTGSSSEGYSERVVPLESENSEEEISSMTEVQRAVEPDKHENAFEHQKSSAFHEASAHYHDASIDMLALNQSHLEETEGQDSLKRTPSSLHDVTGFSQHSADMSSSDAKEGEGISLSDLGSADYPAHESQGIPASCSPTSGSPTSGSPTSAAPSIEESKGLISAPERWMLLPHCPDLTGEPNTSIGNRTTETCKEDVVAIAIVKTECPESSNGGVVHGHSETLEEKVVTVAEQQCAAEYVKQEECFTHHKSLEASLGSRVLRQNEEASPSVATLGMPHLDSERTLSPNPTPSEDVSNADLPCNIVERVHVSVSSRQAREEATPLESELPTSSSFGSISPAQSDPTSPGEIASPSKGQLSVLDILVGKLFGNRADEESHSLVTVAPSNGDSMLDMVSIRGPETDSDAREGYEEPEDRSNTQDVEDKKGCPMM